jgi:glycosyltransferase involved in cell wall biosynthesis
MEKELKVLLLSDAPMALNEGGISQTLYNLFCVINPKNLLAIAPVEELIERKPTAPYDQRYKSYKSVWIKIPANRITRRLLPFIQRLNFSICELLGYRRLKRDIAIFNPDVIVSCPNSPIGVLMHRKLLSGLESGKHVIPYFMDDWMYKSNMKWLNGNVHQIVNRMLNVNKRWIMISNELAGIFKERYIAQPTKVLCARNPVDVNNAPADKPYIKGDPFTFAYAGALWPMHFDSFYAFAKAVQQLNNRTNVQLIWYAPASYWEWRKGDLSPLGVIYGGHISYDKVHETLNKADALLITSSFKEEYYTHSKGSLQTKITDYCKSKKLIISCGPEYSANHNFIKEKNCGLCIETDDSELIGQKLAYIMDHMADYTICITNGWESLKQFSKEVVHHDLQAFLQETSETA